MMGLQSIDVSVIFLLDRHTIIACKHYLGNISPLVNMNNSDEERIQARLIYIPLPANFT